MKKIIVIGANSFIARNFIFNLLDKYSSDVELELYDYQEKQVDGYSNYHKLNILDKNEVLGISLNCDLLYIFSGKTGTLDGFENYSEFININEIGLLNILNACREQKFKGKLIFPSSRLVYKGSDKELSEEDPNDFKTIYAVNKYSCEQYLRIFKNMFDIDYCILRICVPYGTIIEADPSYGTIGFMLKQAIEKRVITLFGDGSVKRTFIHMDDLCSIFWQAGLSNKCINDVFNVGGEVKSLLEVARIISEKYNAEIKFINYSKNQLQVETGSTYFSDKKLQNVVAYSLKHTLDRF